MKEKSKKKSQQEPLPTVGPLKPLPPRGEKPVALPPPTELQKKIAIDDAATARMFGLDLETYQLYKKQFAQEGEQDQRISLWNRLWEKSPFGRKSQTESTDSEDPVE